MNYFAKRLRVLLLSSAILSSMILTSPFQYTAIAAEGTAAEMTEAEPLVPAERGDDLYTDIPVSELVDAGGQPQTGIIDGIAPTLTNGSFETSVDGATIADNWTAYTSATSQVELTDSTASDGQKAQRISASSLKKLGIVAISQQVVVAPYTQYILNGDFNISNLNNAVVQVYVDYFDAAGKFIKSASATQSSSTDAYRQLSLVRVTPSRAASMKIYVLMRATQEGGSGSFTVDRMELTKTDRTLDNPGFENYSSLSGTADLWQLLVPGGDPNQAVVTSPVYAGTHAQQVAGRSIPGGKYVIVSQWLEMDADTSYTVTGQFKIDTLNNAKVQLYLDYYDANENFLGMYWVETSDVTTGYKKLINEHVTPAKTAYARVYAVLRSTQDNASGHFYVDNMSVSKTSDL